MTPVIFVIVSEKHLVHVLRKIMADCRDVFPEGSWGRSRYATQHKGNILTRVKIETASVLLQIGHTNKILRAVRWQPSRIRFS